MPKFFSTNRSHPSDIQYDTGHATDACCADVTKSYDQREEEDAFCNKCRCITISSVLVAALVVALSLIATGDPNPLNYFIPVDPPGASAANRWDATAGLTLTVESAVDDIWAPIVEQSLAEWDVSHAVSLNVVRVARDVDCSPTDGRLKICNADYGETPWHGINIKLVDHRTNLTVHSVAKLNDRYNEGFEEKLYIACHEIGHGLGLGHTDEDHFNRDRGDCMDYTIRPANNMNPGQFNLDLLVELYGTPSQPLESFDTAIDGPDTDRFASQGDVVGNDIPNPRPPSRPQQQQQQDEEEEEEEEEENENERRHNLRRRKLGLRQLQIIVMDLDIVEAERFAEQNCRSEVCYFDVPNYGTEGGTIIVSTFLKA